MREFPLLLSRANWSTREGSLTALEGGVVVVFIFHMTTIIIAAAVVTKICKQMYSTDQDVRYLRADYS